MSRKSHEVQSWSACFLFFWLWVFFLFSWLCSPGRLLILCAHLFYGDIIVLGAYAFFLDLWHESLFAVAPKFRIPFCIVSFSSFPAAKGLHSMFCPNYLCWTVPVIWFAQNNATCCVIVLFHTWREIKQCAIIRDFKTLNQFHRMIKQEKESLEINI